MYIVDRWYSNQNNICVDLKKGFFQPLRSIFIVAQLEMKETSVRLLVAERVWTVQKRSHGFQGRSASIGCWLLFQIGYLFHYYFLQIYLYSKYARAFCYVPLPPNTAAIEAPVKCGAVLAPSYVWQANYALTRTMFSWPPCKMLEPHFRLSSFVRNKQHK